MIERTEIQKSFEKLPGMNCFVCAPKPLNPSGLNLVFEEIPEGARTEFRLPAHFQSYPGYLHGGILSAVLDETMAYAGVFKRRALPFTKTLTLNFRQAVKADETYKCESAIAEMREDGFGAKAWVRDGRGRTLMTATGEFVLPTLEMAKRMMPGSELGPVERYFR